MRIKLDLFCAIVALGFSLLTAAEPNLLPAEAAAGVQLAARQSLFDYATVQGLTVLKDKLNGLAIPDVEKTFHVPVLGDFRCDGMLVAWHTHPLKGAHARTHACDSLKLYDIRVDYFTVSAEDAKLVILDKYFNR